MITLGMSMIRRRDGLVHAIACAASILGGTAFPGVARAAASPFRIGGTGMALAAMRQVASAFAAGQSDAVNVVVLPSLGTKGGIAAVAAGAIDIALSARALTADEQRMGLSSRLYARTPMAFVTHPETNATNVAMQEVERILMGDVTKWPDGSPLRLVRREPSDADWTLFRTLSPSMDKAITIALKRPGLLTVATDQANAEALERLKGSFGAVSIGQLQAEHLKLTALSLDGVAPSVENLRDGRYPLSRSLYAVWGGGAGATAHAFLAYLLGEQGQALLAESGHLTAGQA